MHTHTCIHTHAYTRTYIHMHTCLLLKIMKIVYEIKTHAGCKQTRVQVVLVHKQHVAHGRVQAIGEHGIVHSSAFKMLLQST